MLFWAKQLLWQFISIAIYLLPFHGQQIGHLNASCMQDPCIRLRSDETMICQQKWQDWNMSEDIIYVLQKLKFVVKMHLQ